MVQPRPYNHLNLLTRWTRMLVAPSRDWSVFQQIFVDHWEAFQHAHPRYQTPSYNDLVGKMLEIVQETRRFLLITGGGVVLLKKPLRAMLDAAEVEADRDYFLVNQDLASVLNSVGALFAVLFMTAKK